MQPFLPSPTVPPGSFSVALTPGLSLLLGSLMPPLLPECFPSSSSLLSLPGTGLFSQVNFNILRPPTTFFVCEIRVNLNNKYIREVPPSQGGPSLTRCFGVPL